MKKLSQSEDLSSRIKFMLMDVLDLKQNRWVPRREGEKPKTIDEIRGELEKERLEKELSLQEDIIKQPQMGYPSQRRDGGRDDERKKSSKYLKLCFGLGSIFELQDIEYCLKKLNSLIACISA